MKKLKFERLILVVCLIASLMVVVFGGSTTVFALSEEIDLSTEQVVQEMFGNKSIKSTDYLYNLNDSADFVYVNFENYGYAVFLRETSELLEYASAGSLPYSNTTAKKYYGGPANYFEKTGEQTFVSLDTNETFSISSVEAENYSRNLIDVFSKSIIDRTNVLEIVNPKEGSIEYDRNGKSMVGENKPPLDDEGIIISDLPGTAGTTYIPNAQYFLNNPRHGTNSTGTCGAVAAQLMLSYHNYYSDRRIIAPQHLNGGWNVSGNGNIFDPVNYSIRANDPNVCIDPQSMTRETLGSNGDAETTAGTYFNICVNAIPASATTNQVRNGIRNILTNRNSQIAGNIDFTVNSHLPFLWIGPIGENGIKSEIDAGRPVIILMQESLGGWNHYIVAYGYQNMVSPTNGETYSGYITHFGHSGNYARRLNVWVNSAWCYSYVSMEVNHVHNYNIDTGNIINNTHRELRCNVCGHRTVDNLYDTTNIGSNEIRIDSPRYPLSGNINIPTNLNDRTVTKIGDYAFEDNTTLTKVTIPLSVAYIGDHAFSNCTNLSQVEISDETTSILGSTPFSGCIQLYNTVVSIRTDYHRIIDDTGRLIWMAHDFVYDDNHSSTHHDLICVTCGFEDTKSHNKHVVNGIEVCSTCPWVGGAHVHHEHTHSYIPIPHNGKFPINLHKAYCFCGEYIEEMCLGRIAEDGKAYCIHCGRDMTGALGQIINRILLPESDFHDNDIYCIGDGHSNDCCITKDGLFLSELKNVLYMDVKRRERSFYGGA